jgi:ClpP class serine protease
MDTAALLVVVLVAAVLLQPALQRQLLAARRRRALARLARLRGATVITLLHRQESVSFLGLIHFREIDLEDSESVLRAIRETPPGRPIEIVLRTPGGLVVASSQIATALADHEGPVTAVVPHYAMSGGTLIALAADRIVMDPHAALGAIDPQIDGYPASSIIAAVQAPGDHDDETLILADVARTAIRETEHLAVLLLRPRLGDRRARDVAAVLTGGTLTHDHALTSRELQGLGLPVVLGVPEEERALMRLFPQPRGRRPSVEYAPGGPAPVRPPRPGAPPRARGRRRLHRPS